MNPTPSLTWQVWDDDGGTVVWIDDQTITLELICDASQRRHRTLCRLSDYDTERSGPNEEPIRTHIARSFDAATAEAIAATVRARLHPPVTET